MATRDSAYAGGMTLEELTPEAVALMTKLVNNPQAVEDSPLLQLLLADVAQNFQSEEAKPWLQALIDAEDEFDRQGLLEHHFSCAIARPRPAVA